MEQSIDSSLQLQELSADSLIWTQKQIQPLNDFHISLEGSAININNKTNGNINKNGKNAKNAKQQSNTNKFNHKDDILTYIKPDYGSLGEFITGVNITTDFIKQKKKKYDPQEDSEEKKIRTYLQNKNLNKVLTNSNSTTQQRNVACKLFIERTFQEAFGSPINEFYQQQAHKLTPQQKKGSLNINSLSDALDEIVNKSKQKYQQRPNNGLLFMKEHMKRNRSFQRDKTEFINEKQMFLKLLLNLKNTYRSLHKNQIPDDMTAQFRDWQQKYPGSQQSRALYNEIRQSIQQSNSGNQELIFMKKNMDEKVFIVNEKQVIMCNLTEISSETVLYILSKVSLCALEEITIIKCQFNNSDVLNLFLDLLGMQAKNLQALVIDNVLAVQEKKVKEKFSGKIKIILQVSGESLLILKLNNLGLQTKDFCVLCLGIGSSRKLELVEIKNNNIDEHGKKSFDVLIKFFKNLQFNLQGNPINNEISKGKGSRNNTTTTLPK